MTATITRIDLAGDGLTQDEVAQNLALMKSAALLRDALVILSATCRRMDCEVQDHRPSEAEYQAALAIADAALAVAGEVR
jgi:hypothetical protein